MSSLISNISKTSSTRNFQAANFNRRDIKNFIHKRLASKLDDAEIGHLLVKTFLTTYSAKMPQITANQDRVLELLDAAGRREHGFTLALVLGRKIIGTACLIHPMAPSSQSWLPNYGNIRCVAIDQDFSGLSLSDELLLWAIDIAKTENQLGICLHVYEGAEKVAAVYEKHGFSRDPRGDFEYNGQSLIGYSLFF